MEQEMMQSLEWLESQKIEISVDLFAATKEHLQFLRVVDQNCWLYDGPILEKSIYRYNAYWLPLLAKYSETSSICEGPLVAPLDCEWIWHCHRLNPVRYASDCKQLYGKVLDNDGIVSSTNGSVKTKSENLWKRLYPMEPYDINFEKTISEQNDISSLEKYTTYDLVSAVKRQSSFYSKVLRAHLDNEIMIYEAVGRYKSFLYLIKRNREISMDVIGVPTYDIDLIWHTHQLHPSSYYNDVEKLFGNVLQHDDDIDFNESKDGKMFDDILSETTVQWEEKFGQKYWKSNVEMNTNMVAEEKNDGCVVRVTENKSNGIPGVAAENKSCCWCYVTVAEKKSVGFVLASGKKSDGCVVAEAEKKNKTNFFAVAAEKNGGCGTLMKNNAIENTLVAKVGDNVIAA